MTPVARLAWVATALLLWAVVAGAEDFPGISVEPPQGGSWVQVQRDIASLVWMRQTGRPDVSLGVALLTQGLDERFADHDEFLAWVRRTKGANPDAGRFRLVSNQVSPAGAEFETCARYTTLIEDRSAARAVGTALRLDVSGLACLHPDEPGRYFDIQYSVRLPAGLSLPAELVEEGRAFVESARFRPAPADGNWSLGEGVTAPVRRESA